MRQLGFLITQPERSPESESSTHCPCTAQTSLRKDWLYRFSSYLFPDQIPATNYLLENAFPPNIKLILHTRTPKYNQLIKSYQNPKNINKYFNLVIKYKLKTQAIANDEERKQVSYHLFLTLSFSNDLNVSFFLRALVSTRRHGLRAHKNWAPAYLAQVCG